MNEDPIHLTPEDMDRFGKYPRLSEVLAAALRDAEQRGRVEGLTQLFATLNRILVEVRGRRWICEGRGPYRYDDDRYRKETGYALDAIEKIALDALAEIDRLEKARKIGGGA